VSHPRPYADLFRDHLVSFARWPQACRHTIACLKTRPIGGTAIFANLKIAFCENLVRLALQVLLASRLGCHETRVRYGWTNS